MNEVQPFPLSQCQTITSLEFEVMDKDRWIMEEKIDGWRMQFHVTPDQCTVWTRTNHDATGKMPRIEEALKEYGETLRLDGEVVWLDENGEPDYNYTARCLGSSTEICVMKQYERPGQLVYFVFDILAVESVDLRGLSLAKRKGALKTHLSSPGNEFVVPMMGYEPSNERHAKNFQDFLEGSVLKSLASPYAGRRYKSWLKLKEVETITVQIVGYKEGQGKFLGLIGAINWKDPKTGVTGFCSGMDDDTRVYITDNAAALMNTWIEIKHYGQLVDSYRHPQFQRFREDINAQ